MKFERYAIYWAPPAGSAFAAFGKAWLGADAEAGAYAESRDHFGLDPALSEAAAASPRRYTLHATIKAPFRLDGAEDDLRLAMRRFCAPRRQVKAGALRLWDYDQYLTFLPEPPVSGLNWLAAECVTHFDRFRAPLNEADRARRPARLPPAQAMFMEEFGYPYVLSEFRFHVTLAGPLPPAGLASVNTALAPVCAPFSIAPLVIEELCLFGDPGGGGPFKLIERFALMR